ncbi:MAG: phosphatase PAP2 family protein [Bacteriovoracaceae bacterium]
MFKLPLLLVILFSSMASMAMGEEFLPSQSTLERLGLHYDPRYLGDERLRPGEFDQGTPYFIPFDPSREDLSTVKLAGSAAILLFLNDQEVQNFIRDNSNSISDRVTYFGDNFGEFSGPALVTGTYIWGVITQNENLRRYVRLEVTSLLAAGLTTLALKNIFGRARPNHAESPYDFNIFERSASHQSFPSGHTTEAFVVATLIAEANKDKGVLVPILSYSTAALTAYARIHGQNHWASDTVIGALIGHIVTKAVLGASSAKRGFLITPIVDSEGHYQLQITYSAKPKKTFKNCSQTLKGNEDIRSCFTEIFNSSFEN